MLQLNNLIEIEGSVQIKKIYFKYDLIKSDSGRVTFNKPFPNKCLSVMLTDYRNDNDGISQGISNFDKNGFNFFTSLARAEYFYYLAIGY